MGNHLPILIFAGQAILRDSLGCLTSCLYLQLHADMRHAGDGVIERDESMGDESLATAKVSDLCGQGLLFVLVE
jgi:hypothetical protein